MDSVRDHLPRRLPEGPFAFFFLWKASLFISWGRFAFLIKECFFSSASHGFFFLGTLCFFALLRTDALLLIKECFAFLSLESFALRKGRFAFFHLEGTLRMDFFFVFICFWICFHRRLRCCHDLKGTLNLFAFAHLWKERFALLLIKGLLFLRGLLLLYFTLNVNNFVLN